MNKAFSKAFTIVELLIVVIVIAILATITMVAYNGITNNAKESALKSDLRNASTKIQLAQAETGNYPENTTDLPKNKDTTYQYRTNGSSTFCITATTTALPGKSFYTDQDGSIKDGTCPGDTGTPIASGSHIQTVTAANCSTARTMVVDARDNHTYWIQKMPDNKCWMLTNLAYAGNTSNGGTNQYGDVKTNLINGTDDGTGTVTLTQPKYYIPPNANPTINPTQPSTDTTGGGSGSARQYGYFYNWCAAMAGQATSACANATTPTPTPTPNICPAGWRLPTGGASGEFQDLADSLYIQTDQAGSERLRSAWLAQFSGFWWEGFSNQGVFGFWRSSTQNSAQDARYLLLVSSSVAPLSSSHKGFGQSVRCVVG